MTTPAQSQQQPPAQPAPPATIPPATLAAMAPALASALLTAASAAAVVALLKARFQLSALFWAAMLMVLSGIVIPFPPPVTGFAGAAGERTARLNIARHAQYAISAAQRVMGAMLSARSHGGDVLHSGKEAVERERRFFQMHLGAMGKRSAAAMAVDMAAMEHGPILGWASVLDSRTSRECRKANGHNFYAGQMPDIGYPGSVHPSCRCRPVAPWPGAPLLPGSGPKYNRRAAA